MSDAAALEKVRSWLGDVVSPAQTACDLSGQSESKIKWGVQLGSRQDFVPLKAAYYLLKKARGEKVRGTWQFHTHEAQRTFRQLGLTVSEKPPGYWSRALRGSVWAPLPDEPEFELNAYYKRAMLHEYYGGQMRGGIITPKKVKAIFLISGEAGEKHGYHDKWHDDGSLTYYGEGQTGPMRFIKGNKAVRDHQKDGKRLHVFKDRRGKLQYAGEFELVGYDDKLPGHGRDKGKRTAITFELVPCGALNRMVEATEYEAAHDHDDTDDLDALYTKALEAQKRVAERSKGTDGQKPKRQAEILKAYYERLKAIVVYALERANGICEACDTAAPFKTGAGRPFLEVHHIHHLSEGGIDHPSNVASVCPNCHREAHHGKAKAALNTRLQRVVREKEAALGHAK